MENHPRRPSKCEDVDVARVYPIEEDSSGCGVIQAVDQPEEGALPGTRWSEDGEDLSLHNRCGDLRQHADLLPVVDPSLRY